MNSRRNCLAIAVLLAAVAAPSTGQATPIQWSSGIGGNDHWYEYVGSPGTWFAADTGAQSHIQLGTTGYLATVTSAAENTFIQSILLDDAWLGGSDAAVEGEWRWVTGPEAGTLFTFTNWYPGEPNSFFGEEDYMETYLTGQWNDEGHRTPGGYVVEYTVATTPIPGAVLLFLTALAGMGTLAGIRGRSLPRAA
jgi:hypothetical protein